MIKSNYKQGDKVESTKQGILNGLQGEVLSNNADKQRQQVEVLTKDTGKWNFSYNELKPIGQTNTLPQKESSAETLKKATVVDKLPFETEDKPKQIKLKITSVNGSTVIKEKGGKNKVENLELAPTKGKRSYNKKPKEGQKKEKRKYTKKVI